MSTERIARDETEARPDSLRVFVSYSRTDVGFTDELRLALTDKGYTVLLDRDGIDAGEAWKQRLSELIFGADTVVFVLTETSVKSEACVWETAEAVRLGKRIFVVTRAPVPPTVAPPAALSGINWISCWQNPSEPGSSLIRGLLTLADALRVDLPWLRERTRLQEQSAAWIASQRAAC